MSNFEGNVRYQMVGEIMTINALFNRIAAFKIWLFHQ